MAKQTTGGPELAKRVVSGTFTGAGQSGNAVSGLGQGAGVEPSFYELFNIALWGTFVASIQLEKSFDGGASWQVVSRDNSGTAAIYTAAVTSGGYEPERGVSYRWNCTSYTSGTVNYRISS